MRLYFTPTALAGHRWNGTQDDARAAAMDIQRGVSPFAVVDMPDAKPARIAWLNAGGMPVDHNAAAIAGRLVSYDPASPGGDLSARATFKLGGGGPPELVALDLGDDGEATHMVGAGDGRFGGDMLDIGPVLAATPAGAALKAEQVERDHYAADDILANWAKRASAGDIATGLVAMLARVNELGAPAIDALTARLAFDGPAAATQGALGLGVAVARTLEAIATLKVSTRGPWPADQDIHRTPAP